MSARRPLLIAAALLLCLVAAAALWVRYATRLVPVEPGPSVPHTAELVERGAYLARAGNCAACHTERGGAAYAGGKGIDTPFGTVYASNLTPDAETGIGRWSAGDFWRALHHGQSRDGRLLYPAFPYPDYARVTREDSDALHAFLMSLPPVREPNRTHTLRFPYDTQAALVAWRTLFFSPEPFRPDTTQPAEWNRGAYLTLGLGHCMACHAPRNALGATASGPDFSGGQIPMQGWYAPSLASPKEAGVQDWPLDEVVRLLRDGHGERGATMGPMAEVVAGSTGHLNEADLRAMGLYLQSLPVVEPPAPDTETAEPQALALGQRLYAAKCAQCHGENGVSSEAEFPSLAGHRTVTMASSANLVRVIIGGGFPPTTPGNPAPYGMPPFGQELSDAEIAALASYVRGAWGHMASRVLPLEVQKLR
jgi:mono/diheme cytochrome c family protein